VKHRLVSAAAAIAAVTAAAVTAVSLAPASATTTSATAGALPARPAVAAIIRPSYVVVNEASSLKVFNTATGAVAGTLKAPAGLEFDGVADGGTSRTFLAYADPVSTTAACHAYYYRFGVAATGKPSGLTLLRSIPGSAATAIAASPGGGTYAYSAAHCDTVPPNGLIGISGRAGNHAWAYDEGDDYTFSLAASANARVLALSLFAGSGWSNLLLNTKSRAATVDSASRILPAVPYAQTLAISPGGTTLYACISSGPKGELAAYSAVSGKLIRVLHRWTLAPARSYFCQVSADETGRVLLASYSSNLTRRTSLIGINPREGTAVTLPVKADYVHDGVGAAW
jgi:hypothetical protein